MTNEKIIDRKIAALEAKLADLRKRKLAIARERLRAMEAEINRLNADISSNGLMSLQIATRKGNPKGGPRGRRLKDEEVLALLTREVKASGETGISAREAAKRTGVFYLRAIKAMDEHFKKSGTGKWTRYRMK